jgi:uncharacterized protein
MRSDIESFLSLHRIAMIGVSQDPKHFSRAVYRAWRDRGYDVVPVNPKVREVETAFCYSRTVEIAPPVEAALVLTPAAVSEEAVKDCVAAGVRRVWLYRRSPAAEAFCVKNGADLITGECPLMYLPNQAWPHRLHRWFHARA